MANSFEQVDPNFSQSTHGNLAASLDGLAGDESESEAYSELLSILGKKAGAIPADLLVRQLLIATHDFDWPVKVAAMEALLRRLSYLKRDNQSIVTRPQGKRFLGVYRVKKINASGEPYHTLLLSIDPLEASCDCPDFIRNSLGLCKHILCVLENLYASELSLKRALKEQEKGLQPLDGMLSWSPFRPGKGKGDLLEQMCLRGDTSLMPERLRFQLGRFFNILPGSNDLHFLKNIFPEESAKRLDLVRNLLRIQETIRQSSDGRKGSFDPALRGLLQEEERRLSPAAKCADVLKALPGYLKTMNHKLYEYQIKGVEKFLENGRLLLADDMGLGKTIQAIAACHALWHSKKTQRGLLIVPASLKSQWLREWQSFSDIPVTVVDGGPEQRASLYESTKKGFLIANYEQVLRDLQLMQGWAPDFVILDEAQRIKNWATKTALFVKKLQSPYRLILTGTPMENRLEELSSLMQWIDDLAMEPSWRLVPWHSSYLDGRKEIGGMRNLDSLRSRLSKPMLRRVRQEVLDQLPQRTDTRVPVQMTPAQMSEHDELSRPIIGLLRIGSKRPLTQAEFLKLMMLLNIQRMISNGLEQYHFEEMWDELSKVQCPGEAFLSGLSSPKLLELREIISSVVLNQNRKVVIFSQWRRMLKLAYWAIEGLLSPSGLKAVYFTGHEGQKRRTQNIVDFHDDPDVRILFATDAGGVGLNLQRAANCCINLEPPWNPAVLEQRIGRIYRLGQKKPIDVYNLVTDYGIESRIAVLINNKKVAFSSVFDGKTDQVSFEDNGKFLKAIEKLMEPLTLVPSGTKASQDLIIEDEEISPELESAIESEDSSDEDSTTSSLKEDRKDESRVVAAVDLSSTGLSSTVDLDLPSSPAKIQDLFSRVEITKLPDGNVNFKAPPEAANALAAMFQGMASLFGAM